MYEITYISRQNDNADIDAYRLSIMGESMYDLAVRQNHMTPIAP